MISLPNPTKTLYTEHSSDNDMTATFAQFQAEQDARNTVYLNIVKYGMMLCDALQQDAPDGYTYALDSSGRKYHKVFMYIDGKRSSIHAFIDKKTGEVYKPASLKAPAKGVRYNVLSISSREEMFEKCDWAGGYLYMR
jgi:hypothetical protein